MENSDLNSDSKPESSGSDNKEKNKEWLKSGSSIAAILGLFATLITYISNNSQLRLENRKFLNNIQIQYFDRLNQNNGVKSPASEIRLFKSIKETSNNESISNWAESEMQTLKTLNDINSKIQIANLAEIKAREFVLKSAIGEPRNKATQEWEDKREILKNLMNEFVAEGGSKPLIKLEGSPWDEDTRDEGILAKQIQNDILRAQLELLKLSIIKKKAELHVK